MRYIGQSVHLEIREAEHFYSLRKGIHFNKHLQSAFNKYRESQFEFEILEECSQDKLNDRETFWKLHFDPNTYNLGNTGNVNTTSEATKRKTSSTLKAKYAKMSPQERRAKFASHPNPNLGKKLSQERKDKISKSLKGRKQLRSVAHSEALRNSSTCKRKIVQYDKSGTFIKIWESVNDAARYVSGDQGNISTCCRGGQKSAYGFIWKYANEVLDEYECKPHEGY